MKTINHNLTPAEVKGSIGKTISALGGAASCAADAALDAQRELEIAAQVNQRTEALTMSLARHMVAIRRATGSERESLLRVAEQRLAELLDLDRMEREHWQCVAHARVQTAREWALWMVSETERMLTRPQQEAV